MTTSTCYELCATLTPPVAFVLMHRNVLSLMRKSARNTRARIDPSTGAHIVTYPVIAQAIAWTMLPLAVAGAVLMIRHGAQRDTLSTGLVVGGALIALVAAAVAEFTRVRAEWTETALSFTSPWSRPRSMSWNDIVEVRYSVTADWFIVRAQSGAKIRLHTFMGGVEELLEEIKHRGSDGVRGQVETAVAAWKRTDRAR